MFMVGTAAAAPPDDSTNSFVDPFLLESDYLWTDDITGYDTFDGEPGTASNPNPAAGDCGTSDMTATSWWQIRGTGRPIRISTAVMQTNYDTILAVYEKGVGGSIGDLVDCRDDDNFPSDRRSTVILDPSTAGQDYLIQVGRFAGTNTSLGIYASSDAPANDDRSQAQPLSLGPQTAFENFGATPVDVDESCGGNNYGKTVWFRYDAPERGNVVFDVFSSFFTVIGVYRGDEGAPFTCGNDLSTASARTETGDQNAATWYLQVGAIDDGDDYFANGFDPDEGGFLVEVRFTADPDDDDDGVPDTQDRCRVTPGSGRVKDCPDPDNDSFADGIDDLCSGRGGLDADKHQGCPDADGDGVPDGPAPGGPDRCANLNPSKLGRRDTKPHDGCPDTLKTKIKLSRSVLLAEGGIILRFFKVTRVPKGAHVTVICRLPGGGRCGGVNVKRASVPNAQAAARTVNVRSLGNKRLPFGTRITTKVTARYATGNLVRFTVAPNAQGFREQYFCMNRNSSKLRPLSRGCR